MNDFDKIHNRKNSPSIKWNEEYLAKRFGKGNALPLWVADMDFKASPDLINSLKNRVDHGFYGYEYMPDKTKELIIEWINKRHNWKIKREDLTFAPNVLSAISVLIELKSEPGDGVIIQPPVYYPFEETIIDSKRKVLKNFLIEDKGLYKVDFDNLKELVSLKETKIMLMSSPHNPVGRVWTREELGEIAQICFDEDVLIISDEIHMEFIFKGKSFISTAQLNQKYYESIVQLFSAGKTFNLSGNTMGMAHIQNKKLKKDFVNFIKRFHLDGTNVFASTALETVFSQGEQWFNQMLSYLEENLEYVSERLSNELPHIELFKPEGTYLLWLNFKKYNFKGRELENILIEKAGLILDPGRWFGEEFCSYSRLNIACSRELLKEALDNLGKLFNNFKLKTD